MSIKLNSIEEAEAFWEYMYENYTFDIIITEWTRDGVDMLKSDNNEYSVTLKM